MSKLRVLCLHGYHGSSEILRAQMRAWQRDLEPLADFVTFDAPSLSGGDYGWWHAAASLPPRYRNWEGSRAALSDLLARERFDGVFGFSQGAAVAALVPGLAAELGKPLRFAILVGGFVATVADHAALYAALGEGVRSLHLVGRADTIVPPRRSLELAARFEAPVIVEHDGGHVIASTPAARAASRVFLASFLDEGAPAWTQRACATGWR